MSRPRGAIAWIVAAAMWPLLVVSAMGLYLSGPGGVDSRADEFFDWLPLDPRLFWTGIGLAVVLGCGTCIAQARRHRGREPRWALSIVLAVVITVVAVIVGFLIGTSAYYAQFE